MLPTSDAMAQSDNSSTTNPFSRTQLCDHSNNHNEDPATLVPQCTQITTEGKDDQVGLVLLCDDRIRAITAFTFMSSDFSKRIEAFIASIDQNEHILSYQQQPADEIPYQIPHFHKLSTAISQHLIIFCVFLISVRYSTDYAPFQSGRI